MTRSLSILCLLLLVASASVCSRSPAAPTIQAIEPNRALAGTEVVLAVTGTSFVPKVKANLDSPERSAVFSDFALTLSSPAGRVPLTNVTLVSEGQLEVTLPADAAEPGIYDLELVDPRGKRVVLTGALTIYVTTCTQNGDPCEDDEACTEGDACLDGLCGALTPVCANTPPVACLTVSPIDGSLGSQITADAGCSEDAEDAAAGVPLQYSFTLGTIAGESGMSPTSSFTFASAGLYRVTAEVIDSGGLSSFAAQYVVVAAEADTIVVTTGVDEDDAGATPAAPGGTGLSLREAVEYANANTPPSAWTIRFDDSLSSPISMTRGALPVLTAPGATIVGRPGLLLDFGDASSSDDDCITLDGSDQRLVEVWLGNFGGVGVRLTAASSGSLIAESTIDGAPSARGIVAEGSGRIGPRNDFSGLLVAVEVASPAYLVDANRIHGNGYGVLLADGASAFVQKNLIYANSNYGLQAIGSGDAWIRFNVFDQNGGDGVSGGAKSLRVRNNIFTRNGAYGLSGTTFQSLGNNGFFSNTLGDLSGAPLGETDVLDDPLFVNADAGDFRLLRRSQCIDAGLDLGVDLNDVAPGNYDGQAPDIGARETPYAERLP